MQPDGKGDRRSAQVSPAWLSGLGINFNLYRGLWTSWDHRSPDPLSPRGWIWFHTPLLTSLSVGQLPTCEATLTQAVPSRARPGILVEASLTCWFAPGVTPQSPSGREAVYLPGKVLEGLSKALGVRKHIHVGEDVMGLLLLIRKCNPGQLFNGWIFITALSTCRPW